MALKGQIFRASASSEVCFQVPPPDPSGLHRVSILHPRGVQWVISACVSAGSILGCHWLERHHQTPKLRAGCQQSQVPWKGGGTLGTELVHQELCPPKGGCEFLNCSLPPWRSCPARCWDRGHWGSPHLLQEAGEAAAGAPQGPDDADHLAARVIRNADGERPEGRAQLAVKAAVLFHCKVNSLSQGVLYLVFAGGLCAKYG